VNRDNVETVLRCKYWIFEGPWSFKKACLLLRSAGSIMIFSYLLLATAMALSQEENVPVQQLTDVYNAIKAGKVPLLRGKQIYIQSEKTGDKLKAEIYAISQSKFLDISNALSKPENWCEFMPLHLNIQSCIYTLSEEPTVVFYVGRKFYEPPDEDYVLKYRFQITENQTDRFRVQLTADKGPYETSNYIIIIEAILIGNETLIHMAFSYNGSIISNSATAAYLSTTGRDKVGFSFVGQNTGSPVYVKGVQGIIERNVMRYFLALSVYLDTINLNSSDKFIRRAEAWYDLTEQYATQLHELNKQEYLEAKQREYTNQQIIQRQSETQTSKYGTALPNTGPD
jgi:hypothetical protein